MTSKEALRPSAANPTRAVHAIKPKLPSAGHLPELDQARQEMNRTFGQLTLIQHMLRSLDVGRHQLFPQFFARTRMYSYSPSRI
jgi:hypothetical protein